MLVVCVYFSLVIRYEEREEGVKVRYRTIRNGKVRRHETEVINK